MRRGLPIVIALLLLAAFACPLAAADDHKGKGKRGAAEDAERDAEESDAPAPRLASHESRLERQLDRIQPAFGLVVVTLGAGLLLATSAYAARHALRPPKVKPAKKSFDAGRAVGVRAGMAADPLLALHDAPVGDVLEVAPDLDGHRVVVRRGKGATCEYAAGYLTGLFEGAWARDVALEHPACAGKDKKAACVYVVHPALARASEPRAAWGGPTRGAGRKAGASTPR